MVDFDLNWIEARIMAHMMGARYEESVDLIAAYTRGRVYVQESPTGRKRERWSTMQPMRDPGRDG